MRRLQLCLPLIAVFVISLKSGNLAADPNRSLTPERQLVYVGRQLLPDFNIDGKPAHIHTQGLCVTKEHFYVTGRLERSPKRALLMRFDRADPRRVEHVDITPVLGGKLSPLDHPGGFDFDGESFWIPVAVSEPNSRTIVIRFPHAPHKRLSEQKADEAFRLDDHIGAIAYDAQQKRLFGANWDTRQIYVWRPDGTQLKRLAAAEFVTQNADRVFAVQDWKGTVQGRIVAGCVDKSRNRRPTDSKSVLQLIDTRTRSEVALIRLAAPPGRSARLTNEGMAVHKDEVLFLPTDLGHNAEVYRYRWSPAQEKENSVK